MSDQSEAIDDFLDDLIAGASYVVTHSESMLDRCAADAFDESQQ